MYEQTYCVPGTATERTQRGFFGRLRLESFEPGSGVLPHERTLTGPKEDRYKLLRATGVNTSPVVALYRDVGRRSAQLLAELTSGTPAVDVIDDEGTRHRLWPVPADGEDRNTAVAGLLGFAARGPITIADGHHRYETALRYRDERRMTRSCDEDPAFDYLLVLLVEAGEPLTVLPTHRLVRAGAGTSRARTCSSGLATCSRSRTAFPANVCSAAFESPGEGGRGQFGLWIGGQDGSRGAILTARPHTFLPHLPAGGDAVRRLDVTLLGVALEELAGVDAAAVSSGAIGYTKSAREALDAAELRRRVRSRVPARADAGCRHPGRSRRRRRDAPEIDLLLSEGPDRPRDQPPRMVTE